MKTERHFYDDAGEEVSPDKATKGEILTLSDKGSVIKREWFTAVKQESVSKIASKLKGKK